MKACHKSGRGTPNLACADFATLTFWDTCQKLARNPHKGFPNLWALIGSPFGKDYTICGYMRETPRYGVSQKSQVFPENAEYVAVQQVDDTDAVQASDFWAGSLFSRAETMRN